MPRRNKTGEELGSSPYTEETLLVTVNPWLRHQEAPLTVHP